MTDGESASRSQLGRTASSPYSERAPRLGRSAAPQIAPSPDTRRVGDVEYCRSPYGAKVARRGRLPWDRVAATLCRPGASLCGLGGRRDRFCRPGPPSTPSEESTHLFVKIARFAGLGAGPCASSPLMPGWRSPQRRWLRGERRAAWASLQDWRNVWLTDGFNHASQPPAACWNGKYGNRQGGTFNSVRQ